jgi:Lrp/AsnC family transcriptional regulator for asnA, asnC and gidA
MDKIDQLILNELISKDPQMSFSEIAKNIGVSINTVRQRYVKMKKDGVIINSIVSIDLSKLGYHGKIFLMITNNPNHEKSETIKDLKKIKNIISITEISGAFDILAIAPIKDLKSALSLVNNVRDIPNVQDVEITIISNTDFPINSIFGKIMSKKYLSP